MTKYTFSLNNNSKTNNNNGCPFSGKCNKSTNYSKILDDLIAADIKEKNPWLYGTTTTKKTINCPFASEPETIKIKLNTINNDLENAFLFGDKTYNMSDAYKFLANLGNTCPFKKNTTYKLSNGSIIEITDDYIHIDDKMYFFNLMDNAFFYNLNNDLKKTIATIYIDGLKITIKK